MLEYDSRLKDIIMDFKKILFKTSEVDVEKALPDGVVLCSRDGKIQWVNDKASEIFDTSKMHLMTSNISEFIDNPINFAVNSIKSGRPVITKFKGKEIYFDMTANEIQDGYVLDFREAVTGNAISVSDDKPDNTINRDKNIFLTKLSNDFKSPLQSIIGFSQAMTDGLGGAMSEQQDKYLKIIRKNSGDLMYFLNKLTELSYTESGIKQSEIKMFDIVNLINMTVRYNEQLYKDKEIRWNISLAEGAKSTFVSDENIIKSILQNVFEVILKSVEMGEISVDVSVPDDEYLAEKGFSNKAAVLISVSCSSLLLSENDLECLFDPYKIIDSSNRKNVLRAMILACVKNYIQSLHGAIWVESQILKNTKFNMLIPQGNAL